VFCVDSNQLEEMKKLTTGQKNIENIIIHTYIILPKIPVTESQTRKEVKATVEKHSRKIT